VSALLYGGAYAAVSVAPDLRYNLWTMLAVMIGGCAAIAGRGKREKIGKVRLFAAFAPAVAVMLMEMTVLVAG
ncbi:MAG: hypothetical protein JWR77_2376, partial [Rhizorhabdus sp.]|nr:hypothetical protein [Rhizorhabdus sp.]